MRITKSLGRTVLNEVFSGLGAARGWITCQPDSFTWWPSGHATRVWAEPPVTHKGLELTRLHASTAFVRGSSPGDQCDSVLADLNRGAVLSAIVRDETDPSRLTLRASVFVEGSYESTAMLLRQAIGLQALQALRTAPLVAALVRGEPDLGPHPKSGLRCEPAASLGDLEAISASHGKSPSAFRGDDLRRLARIFTRPPCLLASTDDTFLVAEFPFCGESSLLQLSTRKPHEKLGNGLRASLSIPVAGSQAERAEIVRRLNPSELQTPNGTQFLGSWCDGERWIAFTSFYPNFVYTPGLGVHIGLALAVRANWVAERMFHDDWNRTPARSCLDLQAPQEAPS